MPIRPDLRHFYRTPTYREARARVIERAKNYCELCKKPNGAKVQTFTVLPVKGSEPAMFWKPIGIFAVWRNKYGQLLDRFIPPHFRVIRVVLCVIHLDHTPGHDDDSNLGLYCQWCHLNYDKLHHKHTRSARKDAGRPLLEVAS